MKDDNNSRKKLLKKIVDLTDKKKFIEAKELLNTIKDKNILSDSIYYELSAKIHFDMNDFNKALFFLKRLEEIDNGLNYENNLKLVSVYFINGNNEKGWIIFNNLLNQKGASDFEYTKIILQLLEIFINIPKYDLA